MVMLDIAAKALGKRYSTLYSAAKYAPYRHNDGGVWLFDLEAYRADVAATQEAIERFEAIAVTLIAGGASRHAIARALARTASVKYQHALRILQHKTQPTLRQAIPLADAIADLSAHPHWLATPPKTELERLADRLIPSEATAARTARAVLAVDPSIDLAEATVNAAMRGTHHLDPTKAARIADALRTIGRDPLRWLSVAAATHTPRTKVPAWALTRGDTRTVRRGSVMCAGVAT